MMSDEHLSSSDLDPKNWDWSPMLKDRPFEASDAAKLVQIGNIDRQRDAEELRWLLQGVRREIGFYDAIYPDAPFERELAAAFARQVDKLDGRAESFIEQPAACTWDAYLTLKYEIRKLYKQLGGIVSGSDWQTPGKQSHAGRQTLADEAGFAQEEEGTYQRCYGSEAVKEYEDAAMRAFYGIPDRLRSRSSLLLTTSGMKALELAIAAYRSFAGERLPCVLQSGFYGEGIELARTLLDDVQEAGPDDIYAILETSQPVGCLIVDPGQCWPIKPPVDLRRLFDCLRRHRPYRQELLFVIVDRTLTGIANPMFERYADSLPSHIILVSVESGIKYLQYGFDLANVGYLVASGQPMAEETHRSRWIDLLSIIDAGASPLDVRQLPAPDFATVSARLVRLNRNAHWLNAFLQYLQTQGRIKDFNLSVKASDEYLLEGQHWIGTVFYIRLHGELSEQAYQNRIDACAAAAPSGMHLISGGSFGFDSLRLNAIHGDAPEENALRLSAGRAPLDQLMASMRVLAELLLHP
ncbi:Cystathionine beta-lyase/cystathionine gamma-synthase [Cohnella sp. OV330]|nr:Cystathionine beta-lyase/cystathionine gamma-synthase [Cohnella sp. OV330]